MFITRRRQQIKSSTIFLKKVGQRSKFFFGKLIKKCKYSKIRQFLRLLLCFKLWVLVSFLGLKSWRIVFLPWHVGGTATPGEDTCVIRKGAGLVIPPSLYGGDLIITNIYILI